MLTSRSLTYEAACIAVCREARRWRKACRCSGSETDFPRVWRKRKEWCHSSKALQKRAAASRVSKTMQRIRALLHPSMVLLSAIIEVCIRPMLHIFAQYFPYCSWIGGMPIRCDPFRSVTDNRERLSEKPLGCFPIPFLAQSRINQIAIGVNGPIEGALFPFDFEVGLIHIPGPRLFVRVVRVRNCSAMSGANRVSHSRTTS